MSGVLDFDGRRWKSFGVILALACVPAFFGGWAADAIPVVGTSLFLAGLMVWYLPGLLFGWTGFIRFHEFGAAPTGWEGEAIMVVFYTCVAVLLSWPFKRR